MKIKIRYSFILYVIILYFFNLLQYFAFFFISILIHELAHGIIGTIFKLKIGSIEVSMGGFSIEFEDFKVSLSKKVIIFLSGPLINLILAIIIYIMFKEKYLFVIITNLSLFIFNMIPIYPLDGGKIVYEVLLERYNLLITTKILLYIYQIFSILFLLIISYIYINFYNLQVLILGVYILSFCKYNNNKNIIVI